jgi:hypothetical protein
MVKLLINAIKPALCTATIAFLPLFLTNCEGYQILHGVIKDKATGLPIDSVLCNVINDEAGAEKYTNRLGQFEVTGPFGGCLSDCPDIVIRFSKAGYKALEIKNTHDTVFYLTASKK